MDLKRVERANKINYQTEPMDLSKLLFGEQDVIKLILQKSDLETIGKFSIEIITYIGERKTNLQKTRFII